MPRRNRRRPRLPWLAAALLLTGCAVPSEDPPVAPAAAAVPDVDLAAEPGLPLALPRAGQAARTLLEEVAAGCWLDGIVRGGSMVVDRQTGRVIITSETEDLLVADIVPAGEGSSIVRVTGPAAEDPEMAVLLSETLERAAATGETACPPAID